MLLAATGCCSAFCRTTNSNRPQLQPLPPPPPSGPVRWRPSRHPMPPPPPPPLASHEQHRGRARLFLQREGGLHMLCSQMHAHRCTCWHVHACSAVTQAHPSPSCTSSHGPLPSFPWHAPRVRQSGPTRQHPNRTCALVPPHACALMNPRRPRRAPVSRQSRCAPQHHGIPSVCGSASDVQFNMCRPPKMQLAC